MQIYIRTLITFFHDLLSAVWIGGLFTLTLTVMPAARNVLGMGPQTMQLIEKVKHHQRRFVYVAIPGLFLTGLFLGRSNSIPKSLFTFQNPYDSAMTIKLILLIVMTAIAIIRSRRSDKPKEPGKPDKTNMVLMLINLALGLTVLLLSGYMDSVAAVMLAGK
jgi:putative copper export protein